MSKKRRILRLILIIVLGLVFVLYIALPAGFGVFASIRISGKPGEPPRGFTPVSLTAQDGTYIAGWYKVSQNGAVVLAVHGSNGSREQLRPYINMLTDRGYGVLAIDLRGHGESGGGGNAFGWECENDINAAVSFLQSEGIELIGGLGVSLGGEVLLRSCSELPQLKAVVSDGASQSCLSDYLILPAKQSIFESWATRLMYASTGLFTGQTPPETTILESVTNTADTHFLFIAAEDAGDEVEYNETFLAAAGDRGKLWIVPKSGHTQAFSLYPEQYESQVVEFFDSALLGKAESNSRISLRD